MKLRPGSTATARGTSEKRPGVLVDRFGSSAVVTFQLLGSATMELIVQDHWAFGEGRVQWVQI